MSEDLMITQQDLIDWLDRPPSNDDLDLALFISTRLEKFYELEQKLQQKENIIKEVRKYIRERTEFGEYTYAYPGVLNQDEVREINRILDKGE